MSAQIIEFNPFHKKPEDESSAQVLFDAAAEKIEHFAKQNYLINTDTYNTYKVGFEASHYTFDKLIEILSHWDSADMQKNPSYTRALIDRINEKYKEVQQT